MSALPKRGFAMLFGMGVIACGSIDSTGHLVPAELLSVHDAGTVRLVAMSHHKTVKAGDSVEVSYFILNGDGARQFNNDPDLFRIRIEDARGNQVEPSIASAVDRSSGPQVILTLPANGLLGQQVNLACIRSPYAAAGLCDYGFALDDPGRYRIIVQYDLVPPPDSLAIVPMEALHLADTAEVTVAN